MPACPCLKSREHVRIVDFQSAMLVKPNMTSRTVRSSRSSCHTCGYTSRSTIMAWNYPFSKGWRSITTAIQFGPWTATKASNFRIDQDVLTPATPQINAVFQPGNSDVWFPKKTKIMKNHQPQSQKNMFSGHFSAQKTMAARSVVPCPIWHQRWQLEVGSGWNWSNSSVGCWLDELMLLING